MRNENGATKKLKKSGGFCCEEIKRKMQKQKRLYNGRTYCCNRYYFGVGSSAGT